MSDEEKEPTPEVKSKHDQATGNALDSVSNTEAVEKEIPTAEEMVAKVRKGGGGEGGEGEVVIGAAFLFLTPCLPCGVASACTAGACRAAAL